MDRITLRVGDVFSVPIDGTRVGVGQLAAATEDGGIYVAIFDSVASDPESIDIDHALNRRLIFLAESYSDDLLRNGRWTVVGNRPVSENMPLPAWIEDGLGGPGRRGGLLRSAPSAGLGDRG